MKTVAKMLRGAYALIIRQQKGRDITIGKLGVISFTAGYYVYVGSALNGLSARITRHLKTDKSLHWHVDYLLCGSKIVEIVYGLSQIRKECIIASKFAKEITPVVGFGCSDCSCKSHLFYCKTFYQVRKIVRNNFRKCGLTPRIWE